MKNLIDFLSLFGFSVEVEESVSGIVTIFLSFLVLSLIVLLNIINICFYLLSIYIVSHEKFLSKIPIRYVRLHNMIRFYKNIRISLIIYEFIILFICLLIMISISYGTVYIYIHI